MTLKCGFHNVDHRQMWGIGVDDVDDADHRQMQIQILSLLSSHVCSDFVFYSYMFPTYGPHSVFPPFYSDPLKGKVPMSSLACKANKLGTSHSTNSNQ